METILIPILLQIKTFDFLSLILKSKSLENYVSLCLTHLEKMGLTFIWQQNLHLFRFTLMSVSVGGIVVSSSTGRHARLCQGCYTVCTVGSILLS